MREEFTYWYPVDLRNSAKELIPNHLTFFAFHHAALFPEKQWPRGFGINGMIQVEGQKMSKTKGNFVTWRGPWTGTAPTASGWGWPSRRTAWTTPTGGAREPRTPRGGWSPRSRS